jgi:deoxyguanosine kinase
MTVVYLSLGSNLGDRRSVLAAALAGLESAGVRVLRRSSVYETEPVGLADQPWFLNLAVEAETSLSPEALLALIHNVEASLGRTREVRWGPRTIDVDILLYGTRVVAAGDLEIPHPRLAERRFVLQPLVEIRPDLALPNGRTVRQLLDALGPGGESRRAGDLAITDEVLQIRWPRAEQRSLLPQSPTGWLVTVEGPIGVGKTTLARRLADFFRCGLLLEVVEENPFLKEFYTNIRGRAFPTQIFFLLSRHRQQQSIVGRLAGGEDIVSDYMFAKDRLFAGLTLSEVERSLYDAVYALIAPQAPRPNAIVHMRATLPTLLDRIAARSRSFERDLTPPYLSRVIAAYDAFFEDVDATPVIIVDTDRLDSRQDTGLAAVAASISAVRFAEQGGGGTVR